MITLDQLTKIFQTPDGPVVAADHVDMHVPAGEICVLLGPSGCGKTTTLKMVNRIIPATSGRVLIDGQDTTTMDTISLRRGIGYVIQQVGLFPNMTIEENISVVPKLLGWPKSKYLARAAELLDLVALDPNAFLKRYPNELSGGQQQRVGVIRALAADPPVMLMDEPFGAIDPINREIIQDEFLKMQQALNKSILFVSHDIDEAVKMGDKIAIFDSGKLIQLDSPDKTLAMPATPFVESFVGSDRTLKRLTLAKSQSVAERNAAAIGTDDAPPEAGLRLEPLCIVDNDGRFQAWIRPDSATAEAPPTTIHPNHDLRTATSTLLRHGLSALPCVDADGQYVGLVTQAGIAEFLAWRTERMREQHA